MKIIQSTAPSNPLLSQHKSGVNLDKNSFNQELYSAPIDTYDHLKEPCTNHSNSSAAEEATQKNTEKTLNYPIEAAEKKIKIEEYIRFHLLINEKKTEISHLKNKKEKLCEKIRDNFINILKEINNTPINNRDILKTIKIKMSREFFAKESSLYGLNNNISPELEELKKQEKICITEAINLLIKNFYDSKLSRKIIALNREINIREIFIRNIINNSKYQEATTRRHSMP